MSEDKILKMDDDVIEIIDEEGNVFTFAILFSYENEERDAKYVFFYDEEDDEEIMFARYYEDGSISFIEDTDELAEIDEVFRAFEEELESED